jgi:hypothetical protein
MFSLPQLKYPKQFLYIVSQALFSVSRIVGWRGPRVGRCQDSRDPGNDPPTSWLLLPCLTARSGNVRRRISRDAEERDPVGVAICEGPWRWSHAHDGEPEGSEKQPSTCFLLLGNSNTSIMETRLLLLELPRRSIIPIFFGFLIPMGARQCRISLNGGSCRTESWPHSSQRGQIENRITWIWSNVLLVCHGVQINAISFRLSGWLLEKYSRSANGFKGNCKAGQRMNTLDWLLMIHCSKAAKRSCILSLVSEVKSYVLKIIYVFE